MRPVGDITGDMESHLSELVEDHDLQDHEILGLIHAWLRTHSPESGEQYEDGTRPVFYFGHWSGLK